MWVLFPKNYLKFQNFEAWSKKVTLKCNHEVAYKTRAQSDQIWHNSEQSVVA